MITVPDFEVEHYGIAVRESDTATLNLVNESLQKIRDSGEYMEIHKKYFAQ